MDDATKNELKHKIEVIDRKIDALCIEKASYRKQLCSDKENEEKARCEKYVGKYFKTKGLEDNITDYVYAFKILNLERDFDFRYARCLSVINGHRSSSIKEYGISVITHPIFYANKRNMIYDDSTPKMIDYYQEISEEEFKEIYKQYIDKFEKKMR